MILVGCIFIVVIIIVANAILNRISHNKRCFMCFGSKMCVNCIFCFKCVGCEDCVNCTKCEDCAECESCRRYKGGRKCVCNMYYKAFNYKVFGTLDF